MPRYNENGLTDKQQLFADNYIADKDRNGRKAYKAAYPKIKSNNAADANASRLLSKDKVYAYITKRLAEIMKPLHHNQERVIEELIRLGYCDVRGFFDDKGKIKPPHKLPEDCARAVAGFKVVEDKKTGKTTYDYKLVDKNGAIRMLGQNLQMFVEVFRGNIATTHEKALDDLDDDK